LPREPLLLEILLILLPSISLMLVITPTAAIIPVTPTSSPTTPNTIISATLPNQTYNMVLQVGTTQQFRLGFNPTTGTEWWLERVSSVNFLVVLVGTENGNATCPPPPFVGCGLMYNVFSITSAVAGQYTAEFRLGHPWNHTEYYQTAFLKVQVAPSSQTQTASSSQSTETQTVSTTQSTQIGRRCVIATAAYESELAAPVQFLRDFRDQAVSRTYLGNQFLLAFNAWYYSWAPNVASIEAENAFLRAIVRLAIYPLVATLFLSAQIFNWLLPLNGEAAIIAAGLTASSIIGAIYLTPFAFVMSRLRRLRLTWKAISLIALAGIGLTLLGTLLHGSMGLAQNLAALTVIESMILTPTVLVSRIL
jgi:hypothetical protein